MSLWRVVAALSLFGASWVDAYRPAAAHVTMGRRDWLALAPPVLGLVSTGSTTTPLPARAEPNVVRSKGCYQGQGEACSELAENNALIQALQQQSAANREKNERDARNAYYIKNYPDFFGALNQVMIQQWDGTFAIVSDAEADQLKRSGQLYYDIKKTKAGGIDYTQRPVLTFKPKD